MQGPEVRSGDLVKPVDLVNGEEWTFTIQEGANGSDRRISVNYDGFIEDVTVGDELLVDGGIMSFQIVSIEGTDVVCKVRFPALFSARCSASLDHCYWGVHCQLYMSLERSACHTQ